MDLLTSENIIALVTLTGLEIILGIDNVIFIAIIVSKLPKEKQAQVRTLGLALAMIMRVGLLFAISWIMRLTEPLFIIFSNEISGRDLILILGGLFLIGKSTHEIHEKMEDESDADTLKKPKSMASAVVQIIILDLVFSLDSVITAVGMSESLSIMVIAVVIAVLVMLFFAKHISDFIDEYPTFKVLALSFILLIGVMLLAEGWGTHVDKGYIYFAMGFSLLVEFLNIKTTTRSVEKK